MYLSGISSRGASPALVQTLAFNEARLATIAENIANATTPGYRAKRLDADAFQQSLRAALDKRDHPSKSFQLNGDQAWSDDDGYLAVTPEVVPVENALFHDGTNVSIERQMADLAETTMAHELASELLLGYFNGVRKAIRGTL